MCKYSPNYIKRPEILAPAGNLKKLKVAVNYGADAVYLGYKNLSLRKAGNNFTSEELETAVSWAHENNCKVYAALNIFPREKDLKEIETFLQVLNSIHLDGVIISDLGIFDIAAKHAPNIPIHVSTQANVTNSGAAKVWERLGASRIVLARECSLEEIKEIRENVKLELEVFVHGAMCISYSGRCLLSSVMTGRSANYGDCSHPCRWKYHLMEEKRAGVFLPVEEDSRGTYIFNSKDLCLLEDLEKLIDAGVDSFKIEGRTKGTYYVGAVTRAYRAAVESITNGSNSAELINALKDELYTVKNRGYCKGFLFGTPGVDGSDLERKGDEQKHSFVGVVEETLGQKFYINVKNRFFVNDFVTVLCKNTAAKIRNHTGKVDLIQERKGEFLSLAQPNQRVLVEISNYKPNTGDIIRKEE